MSREWALYLEDIRQSSGKILRYCAGMDYEGFCSDEKTFDAVVRNLEIIGEAAKHVPDDIRARIPAVEWRKVAGLRDMLAHAYFGIDNEILWDVVTSKVPLLGEAVSRFLAGR